MPNVIVSGKFRKVRLKALKQYLYGRYRGKGTISITDEGIFISGRHVFSVGARWAIGLGIFVGGLLITGARFTLGFIPIYFLIEYAILKREDITVPWTSLKAFAVDPSKRLLSIAFDGFPNCSPAALKTENWSEALAALREKSPNIDATPQISISAPAD